METNHDFHKSFMEEIPEINILVSYMQKIALAIVSELKQYLECFQKIIIALDPLISGCDIQLSIYISF